MDRRQTARLAELCLLACTLIAAGAVVLIALFVVADGRPALRAILAPVWDPEAGSFGVLPLLAGSVVVTAGAVLLAVPAGTGMALFLTEVAPLALATLVRPMLQGLAGVPSVVYGFAGLTVLVPAIRRYGGPPGFSGLAGALVLAVMVLPTIAAVAEAGMGSLDPALREGALALGATPWQAVRRVLLPAARPALVTATVLGVGRALGETMAVLMVTGNAAVAPRSPLEPVRTLTGNIALEMGYATGVHRAALFATGALLLALVLILGAVARQVSR